MDRVISTINKENMMTNANIIGLLALTAYSVKSNMELNKKINRIEEELDIMKNSFSENNKRSNIAFTRLNQKIESNNDGMKKQYAYLKDLGTNKKINKIEELPDIDKKDDISSALEVLLN